MKLGNCWLLAALSTYLATSACWGKEPFKPIDWKGFGLPGPSVDFVTGSKKAGKRLSNAQHVLILRLGDDPGIPQGSSLFAVGRAVAGHLALSDDARKSLLGLAKDPINYGGGGPYLWQANRESGSPKMDDVCLELIDDSGFIRIYFMGDFTYCWLKNGPGEGGTVSGVWLVSPKLASAIRESMKNDKIPAAGATLETTTPVTPSE